MNVYLWPSDVPTLEALALRIAEIKDAGDTPVSGEDTVYQVGKLLYEKSLEEAGE